MCAIVIKVLGLQVFTFLEILFALLPVAYLSTTNYLFVVQTVPQKVSRNIFSTTPTNTGQSSSKLANTFVYPS